MNISKFSFIKDDTIKDYIIDYIKKSSKEDLFNINVYYLADKWGIERKKLLNIFIEGVFNGVFVIRWNYHCPMCGAVAKDTLAISEATSNDHCNKCNIDFRNSVDKNIEVTFSIHNNIINISAKFKEKFTQNMYEDIRKNNFYEWRNNFTIYGVDLIQNNLFRELFENDILRGQTLEISNIAIIFTDIKESTKLYTLFGDTTAFSLVSQHFQILFDCIIENNGTPVKTIGDAVMGSFICSEDALKASIEAQKRLKAFYKNIPENQCIEVKIGIHSGIAIVVTLNGKLDYFGTTVNLAARIQSSAKANEIVFCEEYLNEECKQIISNKNYNIERSKNIFKGIEKEYDIYHLTVK